MNLSAAPVEPVGEDDELVLPFAKEMVVQRLPGASGQVELHLFYGSKDISFDDPASFAFGEMLARQTRFRAGDAAAWASGLDWNAARDRLEQLLQEGVLVRGDDWSSGRPEPGSMVRPSPLPPSRCPLARSWSDCESVTRELTGRSVEAGYLELVIPIFRVAHVAVDGDGRQVGEANVFPRALRLETPTAWVACSYPGTRHMNRRPMNVTALKAMRLHWKPMMAVLLRVRDAYFRRFAHAADDWTVGRVERLATLVLAVPTYHLVRHDRPLANGTLHPVLSSVFRVTDGLRMAMHQMMFVPIGEPMLPADARVTSQSIFDYAERNYSFHSETGVCAGPQHMIQEFLRVLLEGEGAVAHESVALDGPVQAALDDLDAAFDYGLLGLQAYGTFFSLWPAMARAYEQVERAVQAAVEAGARPLTPLHQRLAARVHDMKRGTYLATEEWRAHRERTYADMFEQCGRGLGDPHGTPGLLERVARARSTAPPEAAAALTDSLRRTLPGTTDVRLFAVRDTVLAFLETTQAILRTSVEVQARINAHLGRPVPTRAFSAADADVHNLLQGSERRLPYLIDELQDALGIDIVVDVHDMRIHPRVTPDRGQGSVGMEPIE